MHIEPGALPSNQDDFVLTQFASTGPIDISVRGSRRMRSQVSDGSLVINLNVIDIISSSCKLLQDLLNH